MLVLADISYNSKEDVLSDLGQAAVMAVDTETENLEEQKLIGVAVAWQPNRACYFEIPRDTQELSQVLDGTSCIFHNALYDLPLLREQLGISVDCKDDTMFMAQNLGYPAALELLSVPFDFNYTPAKSFLLKKKDRLSNQPIEIVGKMCAEHAIGTLKVWNGLKDKTPPSYALDMLLLPVLMQMHKDGIRVDSAAARARTAELEAIADGIKDVCEARGFSPGSSKQVGLALSEEGFYLGLTKSGKQMRTDDEALQSILNDSMIPPLVLSYRNATKTCSTFTKPLCGVNRVYPHYRIVSTGRLASSNPNIQNIPKQERNLYVPEDGDWFMDFDMRQIEPKVMAFMSQDPQMLKDAMESDFYQPTASAFGVSRQTSKTLLLATSYGAGVDTIAYEGKLSTADADLLLSEYRKRYPVFMGWVQQVRRDTLASGCVRTMLGRVRVLENLSGQRKIKIEEGLREGVNTIIQGTASELLKLAMLRLSCYRIVASVHDEILVSTNKDIPLTFLDNLSGIPNVTWTMKKGYNWRDVK